MPPLLYLHVFRGEWVSGKTKPKLECSQSVADTLDSCKHKVRSCSNLSGQHCEPSPCSLERLIGINKEVLSWETLVCCLFLKASVDLTCSSAYHWQWQTGVAGNIIGTSFSLSYKEKSVIFYSCMYLCLFYTVVLYALVQTSAYQSWRECEEIDNNEILWHGPVAVWAGSAISPQGLGNEQIELLSSLR